jgi:hypothetical protein
MPGVGVVHPMPSQIDLIVLSESATHSAPAPSGIDTKIKTMIRMVR